MKSGYKVFWTNHALSELKSTIEYLEQNFSNKEIRKLAEHIELITELISKNPSIFPKSQSKNIHKVVILKYNTLYYQVRNNQVEILSFFSNRQDPKNIKL